MMPARTASGKDMRSHFIIRRQGVPPAYETLDSYCQAFTDAIAHRDRQ